MFTFMKKNLLQENTWLKTIYKGNLKTEMAAPISYLPQLTPDYNNEN